MYSAAGAIQAIDTGSAGGTCGAVANTTDRVTGKNIDGAYQLELEACEQSAVNSRGSWRREAHTYSKYNRTGKAGCLQRKLT